MQQNNRNEEKARKSEAQKTFEEADNAGRFAGDDADAQNARTKAEANIRQEAGALRNQGQQPKAGDDENIRPEQSNAFKAEAQNINKAGNDGNLHNNDNSLEHARNKANQGIKEGRDTGRSDDGSRNSDNR